MNKVIDVSNGIGESLFGQEGHKLKSAPHVMGITAFTATSVTVRLSVCTDPANLLGEQMRLRAALRATYLTAEIPLA